MWKEVAETDGTVAIIDDDAVKEANDLISDAIRELNYVQSTNHEGDGDYFHKVIALPSASGRAALVMK